MSALASQITSLTIVYSTTWPRSRSKITSKLRVTGLCRGIHRWPVNSQHKGPVTRKMIPFDEVIIDHGNLGFYFHYYCVVYGVCKYSATPGLNVVFICLHITLQLCAFNFPISLVMLVMICQLYLIDTINSEVWTHQPLLRVRSWNNDLYVLLYSYSKRFV